MFALHPKQIRYCYLKCILIKLTVDCDLNNRNNKCGKLSHVCMLESGLSGHRHVLTPQQVTYTYISTCHIVIVNGHVLYIMISCRPKWINRTISIII